MTHRDHVIIDMTRPDRYPSRVPVLSIMIAQLATQLSDGPPEPPLAQEAYHER
jgi:hypothetical protein